MKPTLSYQSNSVSRTEIRNPSGFYLIDSPDSIPGPYNAFNYACSLTDLEANSIYKINLEWPLRLVKTATNERFLSAGNWAGTDAEFESYYNDFLAKNSGGDFYITNRESFIVPQTGIYEQGARNYYNRSKEYLIEVGNTISFDFALTIPVFLDNHNFFKDFANLPDVKIALDIARVDDKLLQDLHDPNLFTYESEDASYSTLSDSSMFLQGGRFHGSVHTGFNFTKAITDVDMVSFQAVKGKLYQLVLQNDTNWMADDSFFSKVKFDFNIFKAPILRKNTGKVLEEIAEDVNIITSYVGSGLQSTKEVYFVAETSGEYFLKIISRLPEDVTEHHLDRRKGQVKYAVASKEYDDTEGATFSQDGKSLSLLMDYQHDHETFALSSLSQGNSYIMDFASGIDIVKIIDISGKEQVFTKLTDSQILFHANSEDLMFEAVMLESVAKGSSVSKSVSWQQKSTTDTYSQSRVSAIKIGKEHEDSILGKGDKDLFFASTIKGEKYFIEVAAADGSYLDPNLRISGIFNDDGGDGLAARIVFTATEDTMTFTVAGGKAGESIKGDYRVLIDVADKDDDEAETKNNDTTNQFSSGMESSYKTVALTGLDTAKRYMIRLHDNNGDFPFIANIGKNGAINSDTYATYMAGLSHLRLIFTPDAVDTTATFGSFGIGNADFKYDITEYTGSNDSYGLRPLGKDQDYSFEIEEEGGTDTFTISASAGGYYKVELFSGESVYNLDSVRLSIRDKYESYFAPYEKNGDYDVLTQAVKNNYEDLTKTVNQHRHAYASQSDDWRGSIHGESFANKADSNVLASMFIGFSSGNTQTTVTVDGGVNKGYGDYKIRLTEVKKEEVHSLRAFNSQDINDEGYFHGIKVKFDRAQFIKSNSGINHETINISPFDAWKMAIYQSLDLMWSSSTGREMLENFRDTLMPNSNIDELYFSDGLLKGSETNYAGDSEDGTRTYFTIAKVYINYDDLWGSGIPLVWRGNENYFDSNDNRQVTIARAVIHELTHVFTHQRDPVSGQLGDMLDYINVMWREILNLKSDEQHEYDRIAYPLVIDFNNDNEINLIDPDKAEINYDMDGDGQLERTGWFSADDALIVRDLGKDGKINSIDEISFAQFAPDSNSDLAGLATFDGNRDNVIDDNDKVWQDLMIWQDVNQNGISDKGELLSMEEAEITGVSLKANTDIDQPSGNKNKIVGLSEVYLENGETMQLADVGFAYSDFA